MHTCYSPGRVKYGSRALSRSAIQSRANNFLSFCIFARETRILWALQMCHPDSCAHIQVPYLYSVCVCVRKHTHTSTVEWAVNHPRRHWKPWLSQSLPHHFKTEFVQSTCHATPPPQHINLNPLTHPLYSRTIQYKKAHLLSHSRIHWGYDCERKDEAAEFNNIYLPRSSPPPSVTTHILCQTPRVWHSESGFGFG